MAEQNKPLPPYWRLFIYGALLSLPAYGLLTLRLSMRHYFGVWFALGAVLLLVAAIIKAIEEHEK